MKKILLGLVAGLSLLAFTVPARAQGDADKAPAGDKAPAEGAPAKKGKKAKKSKAEKAPEGGDTAAGDKK